MQAVIDKILTHYEIIGQEKKEKLLILHGWKRSLNEWVPTAKQVTNYQVILLDLPGFGATAIPQNDFSIYDYASFVDHFLEKLNIKKVTLVGHSFGGRIGIILGAKTNLLNKLILVDGAGVEKRTFLAKLKIVFFKTLKPVLPKNLLDKLRNAIGSSDYKSSGILRQTFVKVINEDLSYLLSKIRVPTIIIWGEKDTEVPYWKTNLMKRKIPRNIFRVVWGAGHSPHLEKPREFSDILEENI